MDNIKNLERILRGLGNLRRLAILKYLLREKEATVSNIAAHISLSFKSTSKHLSILKHLDILDSRLESLNVFYRLGNAAPKVVRDILRHIPNSRE